MTAEVFRPRGIVLHVSASTFGDVAALDRWHKERGWSGIGYHAAILNGVRTSGARYDAALDGHVEPGRDTTRQGAHCAAGGMNRRTLGLCCIGNPGDPIAGAAPSPWAVRPYLTARQADALVRQLAAWCRAFGWDPLGTFAASGVRTPTITQHSDHDRAKPFCASLDLVPIRAAVAAALR